MSKTTLYSTSRNSFIEIARRIGNVLLSTDHDKPWLISLDGDKASGKGLIALGIDIAFRPELYENGCIPTTLRTNNALRPDGKKPVVFSNFGAQRKKYGGKISNLEEQNPNADVIIVSNATRAEIIAYNKDHKRHGTTLDLRISISTVQRPTNLWRSCIYNGIAEGWNLMKEFRRAVASADKGAKTRSLFWRQLCIYDQDLGLFSQHMENSNTRHSEHILGAA